MGTPERLDLDAIQARAMKRERDRWPGKPIDDVLPLCDEITRLRALVEDADAAMLRELDRLAADAVTALVRIQSQLLTGDMPDVQRVANYAASHAVTRR